MYPVQAEAIFLTPEYKQRFVQETPVEREVTRWSSHSVSMLQDILKSETVGGQINLWCG